MSGVTQFPTIERIAAMVLALSELAVPVDWSLPHQRAFVRLIDATGKPLEQLTIQEVLSLAKHVRDSEGAQQQLADVEELDPRQEVERLHARLETVQADLDGALDTMEWQRREIGRLRAEAARREGR